MLWMYTCRWIVYSQRTASWTWPPVAQSLLLPREECSSSLATSTAPLQPPGFWLCSSLSWCLTWAPLPVLQKSHLSFYLTKHTMVHKQILTNRRLCMPQLWAKPCRTRSATSGREQRTALCPSPRPFTGSRLTGLVSAPACIALTKLITTHHSPGWALPCSRTW